MKRFFFLVAAAFCAIGDLIRGRQLAINSTFVPLETSRGTVSLDADNAVTFINAVVRHGTDDHHFDLTSDVAHIPIGILLNDQVDSGEAGAIKKNIALFGLYDESLPAVAAAAIPVDSLIVADLATPGRVKKIPTAAGTYIVFGRSRFTVAAAGDPVSIAHCLPYVVVVP